MAEALGAGRDAFLAALAEFRPGAGRGGRVALDLPGGPALLIDDSYNGQPPPCAPGSACWGRSAPARAGGESPCSATCGSWASMAPLCTHPCSPMFWPGRMWYFAAVH
ncbi:hypothetical protein [Teichococcus aestuarii]|uniref:hypothetical protein n=1 Tax=Teichococcus aestuarii TaxID=568898 RepID=UPI003622647D